MKRLICITAVLVLTLIGAGVVQAQNQVQIPVIIHIPQIIIMTLDATELVFDKVDFDYVLGTARLTKVGVIATKREAVTVTIEGNIPYTLYISAPEEYLFGANGDLLHISQLTWGLSRGEADGQGEGGRNAGPDPGESASTERPARKTRNQAGFSTDSLLGESRPDLYGRHPLYGDSR